MLDQQNAIREINLYDLWMIVVKRGRLVIIICSIAATATAIISFLLPKIYKGDVVLSIQQDDSIPISDRIASSKGILSAKEISEIMGNVDKEKRAEIFPRTHLSVSKVNLKVLKDSQDKIGVVIESKHPQEIPKAVSELVQFINNFDMMRINVREVRERLEKQSAELSNIVNYSSELSATYRRLLKGGKLLPMGFNPVDLDRKIADVKLEKLTVDQSIQNVKDGRVKIATQVYVSRKPVKPKIALNIVLAGVVSFLLGIFLALYLEFKEKVKNRIV